MKLRCRLGFHKWMIVKTVNEGEALNSESLLSLFIPCKYLHIKVCEHCPTIIDEIQEYKDDIRRKALQTKQRKLTAEERYSEVLKHKTSVEQGAHWR